MTILRLVGSATIAAAMLTTIQAERRCPGNVDSVPLRQIQGAFIVVPVTVNGSGPFDFLIDSGAQITTIDAQLAAQLGIQSIGSTGVSGVVSYQRESAAQIAEMKIGSHRVDHLLAVVEEITQFHEADPKLRGIVGENFLAHFDFLIDNQHHALCVEEAQAGAGAMASTLKGSRLPLAQPYGSDKDLPFTRPLVIATELAGSRRITLLRLDSGSNAAVLYEIPAERNIALKSAQFLKLAVAGREQDFAVLPTQTIISGGHTLARIAFVQPLNSVGAATQHREDGILPTAVFKRVFVSYSNQFAILEPRE